jgi:integrase
VELCPRALDILKRQLALRDRYVREGKIQHDELFFKESRAPICNLNDPYGHWVWTLFKSVKVRYRESYATLLFLPELEFDDWQESAVVAKQHGHSVQTMLSTYAAWTEGAKDEDIEEIRRAMNARQVRRRSHR